MDNFERYVDSEGNEFLVHEDAIEQIEDEDHPLYINGKNTPECSRRTTHRVEFDDILERNMVYADLTFYKKKDLSGEPKSVYFGYIFGGDDWWVYLGLGFPKEIKDRARDFQKLLDEEGVPEKSEDSETYLDHAV